MSELRAAVGKIESWISPGAEAHGSNTGSAIKNKRVRPTPDSFVCFVVLQFLEGWDFGQLLWISLAARISKM